MSAKPLLIRGWVDFPLGLRQVDVRVAPDEGLILSVVPSGKTLDSQGEKVIEYDSSFRLFPGDVNAHSHPEQSLYVDLADPSWDLPTWCRKTIYRHSVAMTPEHIRLGCCRAFARMLMLGVTTAVVSFYCHNRRKNELDREVIRAARETGIRLYFGRMHYDLLSPEAYPEKRSSQESYAETTQEYESALAELFEEVGRDPLVAVAPALHSFHANSLEAIANGIRIGARLDRLVQFHLSEDRGDVGLCLERYGARPVEVLDWLVRKGEVPRLSGLLASDGIWTDDHEKDLMSEHGISLVLNPRMNRRIKAGKADFPGYAARKVVLFLGTDGEASNEDLSIDGERAFLEGEYPGVEPAAFRALRECLFPFPSCPVGCLASGCGADLKVVGPGGVHDVYVGGKLVVRNGALRNLDLARDVENPLKTLIGKW